MSERPILFSAPMVRAIRDDSKTRTRRMVKTQLPFCQPHPGGGWIFTDAKLASEDVARYAIGAHGMLCPYGQPGDRLWVRETWAPVDYLVGSKLEDPVCVAFAADQTAWCAAEKAKRIENGPACTTYQRLIDNLAEKCSERPKRSFDEKAMPPLRGASE